MAVEAPEKPVKEAKSAAPAELNDEARALFGHFVETHVAPEKKEDPAKPEKTKAEKKSDKAPEKPAKATAKVPEKAPEKPAPQATDVDYGKIAEAAGRGVAEAMEKKEKAKPEPAKTLEFEWLSDDDRADIPILQAMEKMNPDKYKGLAKQYADSIKKAQDYQKTWEKENHGRDFDPNADEHNEFYATTEVDWPDRDFIRAAAKLESEAEVNRVKQETDKQLKAFERKDALREMEPRTVAEGQRNAKTMFDALGEDYAKVIQADGKVDRAVVEKLHTEEPIKAEIIFGAVSTAENEARETFRLFNGAAEFDPKNQMHVNISNYTLAQEREMMKLPADQRHDTEGRVFLPADKYWALKPDERANHWTFGPHEINTLRTAEILFNVKKIVAEQEKKLEQWATKRGFSKNGKEPEKQDKAPEKAKEPTPDPDDDEPEKPVSPTGGDGTRVATPSGGPDAQGQTGLKTLLGKLVGG